MATGTDRRGWRAKRGGWICLLIGCIAASAAYFLDDEQRAVSGVNHGADEAPDTSVHRTTIESIEDARAFFGSGPADARIDNYALLPENWSNGRKISANRLGLVLCRSDRRCDARDETAVAFRLCHVSRVVRGRTSGGYDYLFAPKPCLEPPGRNKLKVIYRTAPARAHAFGLVYGQTNLGPDLRRGLVGRFRDAAETRRVHALLTAVGREAPLDWARAGGISASVSGDPFRTGGTPLPEILAVVAFVLIGLALLELVGDPDRNLRFVTAMARLWWRPTLVFALVALLSIALLPGTVRVGFFDACAQVIPVIIIALALQTNLVRRRQGFDLPLFSTEAAERAVRARLHWNMAGLPALVLLVIAELDCLRLVAKESSGDPSLVITSVLSGLAAIIVVGYAGEPGSLSGDDENDGRRETPGSQR